MPEKFCDAYDTRTGRKLPHKVPESHFRLFKNIAPTPRQRARTTDVTEPQRPHTKENN